MNNDDKKKNNSNLTIRVNMLTLIAIIVKIDYLTALLKI